MRLTPSHTQEEDASDRCDVTTPSCNVTTNSHDLAASERDLNAASSTSKCQCTKKTRMGPAIVYRKLLGVGIMTVMGAGGQDGMLHPQRGLMWHIRKEFLKTASDSIPDILQDKVSIPVPETRIMIPQPETFRPTPDPHL